MLEVFTFSWPVAVTIVFSAIAAAAAAVKIFKKDKNTHIVKLENDYNDLENKTLILKNELDSLKHDIEVIRKDIKNGDKFYKDTFNKLEQKIEKISDLIIELIRTQNL